MSLRGANGVVLERRETKPLGGIEAFVRDGRVVIVATDRPVEGVEQAVILSLPPAEARRLGESLNRASDAAEFALGRAGLVT